MIVERAYLELYTDAELGKFEFSLKYSGKFRGYNANVQRRGNNIHFNLSRKWEKINDDVKIGLIQELFTKILDKGERTQNMELYEIFLKKVHFTVAKTKTDPVLEESFNRVNEKYFYGLIEIPNLRWGKEAKRTLGSYDYGSDTITMSSIFKDSDSRLLDYIMYHEMLHKKHKFQTKNGKSFHHTREFSRDEKKFENYKNVEKEIESLIRKKKKRFKYDFFNF